METEYLSTNKTTYMLYNCGKKGNKQVQRLFLLEIGLHFSAVNFFF